MAAALNGIWRSADRGATWTVVRSGDYGAAVAFDPNDGKTAYAGIGFEFDWLGGSGGVYKSKDGGLTWQQLLSPVLPTANIGRMTLVVSPSNTNILYVGIQNNQSIDRMLGLFKSSDAGATWSVVNAGYCPSLCWWSNALAVSPTDPNLLFGGGSDWWRSANGAISWEHPASVGDSVHPDLHAFAFSADGSRLYVGSDGGVFRTNNYQDARPSWTHLNGTLALTQYYRGFAILPSDVNYAVAGTQDNAVQIYSGTTTWHAVGTCGDGAAAAIDPVNPQTIYSSCPGLKLQKSTNGGKTWAAANTGFDPTDDAPWDSQFTMDPSGPERLYFASNRWVWQTLDRAAHWQRISPDLTGGKTGLCTVTVSPVDPNTVYAGACDGHLFSTKSALSGASSTWTSVAVGKDAISQIAIDPHNPKNIAVSIFGSGHGHVYRSQDAGATFLDVSNNLPDVACSDVLIDPDVADTLYVATDVGVFWTTDNGGSWSPLVAGLPRVAVTGIRMHQPTRTLRAATHGRSMWDLQVPIAGLHLIPRVTGVSPARVLPGAPAATLTITGANFLADSVVQWSGSPRPTTFVSSTRLTANMSATDFAAAAASIPITVVNSPPGGGQSAAFPYKVGLTPVINAGGVIDSASLAPASIGSLTSIYGTDLATGTEKADALPLPQTLGGAKVTVLGTALPIFYASPTQLIVQMRWDVFGTLPVIISAGGFNSPSVSIPVSSVQPGLFSTNGQGTGQGAILIAGTASIAAPLGTFPDSRPVKAGEYLVLFASGLGLKSGVKAPTLGVAAPSDPLVLAGCDTQVNFGTVSVPAAFAGLSPGFVGLYQVNVQVPDSIAPDPALAVSLTCANNGRKSNTVTIAVE